MERILILGGDGYLGWPAAVYFSNLGYEVTVVDNYSKRNSFDKLDIQPLYPHLNLLQRARAWNEHSGRIINVIIGDLSELGFLNSILKGEIDCDWPENKKCFDRPDSIIHFAEQPSAPLSLKSLDYADYTLINNLRVTNNLIWAVKTWSPSSHIIKLGTMGEYGTPNIDIEEGWIDIEHHGRKQKFLVPRQASSIYHTSKIMDTDLLWFGVRNWGIKVTDLMQGPVYGLQFIDELLPKELGTYFCYDEIMGTVINRFIVQAIVGYPLTVFGKGGQTRGYINLKDSLKCIEISHKNPPNNGELNIYNQITETFTVLELAKKIQTIGNQRGYQVEIKNISNPRKESEEHYYNPKYQKLSSLGFNPTLLSDSILNEFFDLVEEYKNEVRLDTIFRGIKWA